MTKIVVAERTENTMFSDFNDTHLTTKNRLYLVSQKENNGYDTFDSFVVMAESEDMARNTHPHGNTITDWAGQLYNWASRPENVSVTEIGYPSPLLERSYPALPHVLCSSFHAG
jgi:hypothetical protein